MKTRHIALFGLDVSSGEDDVTNLERDFLLTFFYILPFSPFTSTGSFFLHLSYLETLLLGAGVVQETTEGKKTEVVAGQLFQLFVVTLKFH